MILLLSPMALRCGITASPPMSLRVSTINTFLPDAHAGTWGHREMKTGTAGKREHGELSRLQYAEKNKNRRPFSLCLWWLGDVLTENRVRLGKSTLAETLT